MISARKCDQMRLKIIVTALAVSALVLGSIAPAYAKPVFGAKVAEGYVLVLRNGGESGGVSTRLELTMGLPLGGRLGLGFAAGIVVPNDLFRPGPRGSVALSIKLTDSVSFSFGPGYQYNPGYAGKADTHFAGLGFGPSYRTGPWTIGFTTGPGWTGNASSGAWGWLFQPSVGVAFQ